MILTRGELRRREEAVVAGFVERNGDKDKGFWKHFRMI